MSVDLSVILSLALALALALIESTLGLAPIHPVDLIR